jgi:hypothetical protein
VVVFGHTHYAQRAVLPGGALYLNTGFWLSEPCCVAIERGTIWFGPQTFVGGGLPEVTVEEAIPLAT